MLRHYLKTYLCHVILILFEDTQLLHKGHNHDLQLSGFTGEELEKVRNNVAFNHFDFNGNVLCQI
jgi:hypothetical protein